MRIIETATFYLYDALARFHATDIPDPGDERNAPEDVATKVNLVLGFVAWAGTAAGVAGVLVTGAMMAMSHKRGESSEHMSRLGMVLGGCVLVATAGPIIQFVFE
jgi:ribose/xylose/arabinose/galactoside ABC-type transport system permease subunit